MLRNDAKADELPLGPDDHFENIVAWSERRQRHACGLPPGSVRIVSNRNNNDQTNTAKTEIKECKDLQGKVIDD